MFYGLASKKVTSENTEVMNCLSLYLNTDAPANTAEKSYAALSGPILTKALAEVAKISAG